VKLRTFVLFSALALFAAMPAKANHPAAVSNNNCGAANSGGSNSCAFASGGSATLPGANQVMVLMFIGPTGGQTLASIADTYYGTGTCVTTTCGNWTLFSAGCGTWSNTELSFSSLQVCAYWAKTGSNSGAESVTLGWTGGTGTAELIGMTSWDSTDVAVTASNPEDTSIYTPNSDCTGGPLTSGSFNTTSSGDIVVSLTPYDWVFVGIQSPNSSGPTQAVFGMLDQFGWASLTAISGVSGTVVPTSAGTHTINWTYNTCPGSFSGASAVYTIALKGGSPAGRVRHRVNMGWFLPFVFPFRRKKIIDWRQS
jgi:hypothetical protein